MKKLITFGAIALMVAGLAVPAALALEIDDASIRIRSDVRSRVRATADTGGNWQVGGLVLYNAEADDTTQSTSNNQTTGAADAMGVNTVAVNSMVGPDELNGDSEMEDFSFRSRARVRVSTEASAYTGSNVQIAGMGLINAEVDDLSSSTSNSLTTGSATATGDSLVVVNSTWDEAF